MTNHFQRKDIDDAAKVIVVQEHQKDRLSQNVNKALENLDELSHQNDKNLSDLDALLEVANNLLDVDVTPNERHKAIGETLIELTQEENEAIDKKIEKYQMADIETIDGEHWEDYWENVLTYAGDHKVDMESDPFSKLMSPEQQQAILQNMKEEYTLKKAHCDKYDYLLAGASGLLTGLIDVFLIGSPINQKVLAKKTDEYAQKTVEKFADILIARDPKYKGTNKKKPQNSQAKSQYLEGVFKIPYDATSDKMLGRSPKVLRMSTKNHHAISLAHYPDPIGLVFSIIDQFTNSGSYFSNGNFVRESYETKTPFALRGNTFLEKLFFGFVNWFGHLMSDFAGSNTSIAKGNRGTGLPIPFTQFFQLFNNVRIKGHEDDIAKMARKVFEKGYDLRHGMALAIPVILNELIIRFLWMIKQYFYHKRSLSEIFKKRKSPELRRMLLVGHGSLCLVDGVDAAIRSGGNVYGMLLNMNIVAWTRFSYAGFNEVRAMYSQNVIDKQQRDLDMDRDWQELLAESH